MTWTARATRFLRSLPDDDATRILTTLEAVTAAPDADTPRVSRLAANLWECRLTLSHRRQVRCMFGYRDGEPVILSALLKKDQSRHQLEIVRAVRSLEVA